MNVMCATCGFEDHFASRDLADAAHLQFDPAHYASWYVDGDIDQLIREW